MTYPPLPAAAEVAGHFLRALRDARREEAPFRHWKMLNVLPEAMCTGILTLPVAPPVLGRTDGTRDTYNATRAFFTPAMRADFPTCQVLCDALQSAEVARQCAETYDIDPQGGFLRIEYIQDTDGAWLEPHRDIPDKLFSMVVY
ncbi:MAG: 2OG-Fe(II) oxygenase, partial [Alphaproteobacteria bacterium]|nr:2OG-Fe(II) oxygenase [Alphaproteobacteria bacterium]